MIEAPPASAYAGLIFEWGRKLSVLLMAIATLAVSTALGQEIESEPIRYSSATLKNAITEFKEPPNLGQDEARL